jgi:O-antigen ligase
VVLRWLRLPALPRREALIAGVATVATALLVAAAVHELGTAGLLIPLAIILVLILITRPLLTLTLVVLLTIVCEESSFGLFKFTSHFYSQVYRDISLLDVLVGLVLVSVFLDVLRHRRAVMLPRALALPLALLALAMVAGVVTGHASGVSLRFSIFSEHILAYLLLLPIAVANLDIDRRQIAWLLGGAMALAVIKSVAGLVEVSEHLGAVVEGHTNLTYYALAPLWLIVIALLTLLAGALARSKLPSWTAICSPLLIACLLLSYRRAVWIGFALGLLLILLLGTSPTGRRVLVPAVLAVVAAIWLVGSIQFESQLPLVKRVTSLSAATLEANAEDRYRLDERANVLSAISQHPITGLGTGVPWQATAAPLSVEHEEGRDYVHFAALWFWLKLGILGLLAYLGVIVGSAVLAWQAWRRSREPLLRAFALASLCGIAGLSVMDTTASFTGVDARFTLVFAVQIGLLALLARRGADAAVERPGLV